MIVHLEDFQQSEIQFIHVLAGEGGGRGVEYDMWNFNLHPIINS